MDGKVSLAILLGPTIQENRRCDKPLVSFILWNDQHELCCPKPVEFLLSIQYL